MDDEEELRARRRAQVSEQGEGPADQPAEPRTAPSRPPGEDPGALGRVLSPSRPWEGDQPPVAPEPHAARPLDRTDLPVPSHQDHVLQAIAEDDVDHGNFGFDIGPTAKGRLKRVFRRGSGASQPFEPTEIAGPPTLQPRLRIDDATLGAAQQNPPRVDPTPAVFTTAPTPPLPPIVEPPIVEPPSVEPPSVEPPSVEPEPPASTYGPTTFAEPSAAAPNDPLTDPWSQPSYSHQPAEAVDQPERWGTTELAPPVPELPAAVVQPTPVEPDDTSYLRASYPESVPPVQGPPAQPRWSQAARPADYVVAGPIESEAKDFSYAPDGDYSPWAPADHAGPTHPDEAARRRRLFRRNTEEAVTGAAPHASGADSANVGMSSAVAPDPTSELSPEPSGDRVDPVPPFGSEVVSPASAVTSEELPVDEPHRRRIFRRGHDDEEQATTEADTFDEPIVDAPVPPQAGFVTPPAAEAPVPPAMTPPPETLSLPPLSPPPQRLGDALQLSDRLAEVERRAELLAQRLEQSARAAEQRYMDMLGSHESTAPRSAAQAPVAAPVAPTPRPQPRATPERVEAPKPEPIAEAITAPAVEPEAPESVSATPESATPESATPESATSATEEAALPTEEIENLAPFRPWDDGPSRPLAVNLPTTPPDHEPDRPDPERSARPEGEPEPDSPEDEVGIDSSIARIPTEDQPEAIDRIVDAPAPAVEPEQRVGPDAVVEPAAVDIDDPSVDEFDAAEFARPEAPAEPEPPAVVTTSEPESEPEGKLSRTERREARRAERAAAVRPPRHAVTPIPAPDSGSTASGAPEAPPEEPAEGHGRLRRAVSWVMAQDEEAGEPADKPIGGGPVDESSPLAPTGRSSAGADLARRLSSYDLTSPFPEEEAQRRHLFGRRKPATEEPAQPLAADDVVPALEELRPTVQWAVVAKEQAVSRALRAGLPVPDDLAESLAAAHAEAPEVDDEAEPEPETAEAEPETVEPEPETAETVTEPLVLEPPEAIAAGARSGSSVDIHEPEVTAEPVAEPEPEPEPEVAEAEVEQQTEDEPPADPPAPEPPVATEEPVRRRPKPYRTPAPEQTSEQASTAAPVTLTKAEVVDVHDDAALDADLHDADLHDAAASPTALPVFAAPGAAMAAAALREAKPRDTSERVPDSSRATSFLERTDADDNAADGSAASSSLSTTPPTKKAGISGATARPRRPRSPAWLRFAIVVLLAVGVAFGLRTYVVAPYYIPSPSMEPTLHGCTGCNNDHVLVDKLSYHLHAVHRGDVVVFNRPESWNSVPDKVLIKRVVGLPGDVLTLKNNSVYVNGQQLQEPYVKDCGGKTTTLGPPNTTRTVTAKVPAHEYFVMGDNRCESDDSRTNGPIPSGSIIGRAFVIIWPLSRIHYL